MICNECETVAHCLKNGCVPKQPSKDEVLKLALETFERVSEEFHIHQMTTAITAIKQALAAQPALKPLTNEQISQLADKHLDAGDGPCGTHYVYGEIEFARAIEAAHGIPEKGQPSQLPTLSEFLQSSAENKAEVMERVIDKAIAMQQVKEKNCD